MNFFPDSVKTNAYVGSLVDNFQQKFSGDCSQKITVSEDCYDPLATLGTCVNSPSAGTELKRGDTSLDELDTNADTNSVPDTDFVSDYFDLCHSGESLEKIYSSLGLRPKWEDASDFKHDLSKDVDTTTTTSASSDSAFKISTFPSSDLFFEDDFRYVTSKPVNNVKSYNFSSDISDKNDQSNSNQNLSNELSLDSSNEGNTSQKHKSNEINCDILKTDSEKNENSFDKVHADSSSVEQRKNVTEINSSDTNDSPPKDKVQPSIPNNTPTRPFVANNTSTHNVFVNKTLVDFDPCYVGMYDIMAPSLFLNGSIYNLGALMEADLYFYPNLYYRYHNLVSRYPVNTNYCVYRGADYNKLVCSCNMYRANGSNSHSTNCNVVAGGVELSTESWPISKASQMYALINTWDRVMKKYKRWVPTSPDFNAFYIPEECNPQLIIAQTDDEKIHAQSVATVNFDNFKSANYLISEITGIKLNIESPEPYSIPNVVPEAFKPEEITKRRKTSKHKTHETLSPPAFPTDIDLSTLSPTQDDEGKLDKRDPNQQNGEKVSGVWYDTNRHLWRVVYMKGNKRRTQGFSSLKLGYEEARRKAIQMRYEMVSMKHTDRL